MIKKIMLPFLLYTFSHIQGNTDLNIPDFYIPLFDAYPLLKNKILHTSFGINPTPIYTMQSSAQKYGLKKLYVKDDGAKWLIDERGRRLPAGNKARKLEFLLAQAKALGYTTVCTVGSAGSNHALETAICAQQLGLDTVLLLNDQRPTSTTVRNLKMMALFAKEIKYSAVDDADELMQEAHDLCTQEGYYYIPMGGSNPLGTLGFVNAMFELKDQINKGILQEPDYMYVTLGSAGTAAGMIIGAHAAGLKSKIIPVRISSTVAHKTNLLVSLVNQTGNWIKSIDPSFPFVTATHESTVIEHDFAGGENTYAVITKEAAEAIKFFHSETHQTLEGTYTGKTLSAMLEHAAHGFLKDKVVLFWNTFSYGTFEELTGSVTDEQLYKAIPTQLIHYLTDDLQDLDQGI